MQLRSVQILRGVAAMMVVMHHIGTLIADRRLGRAPDLSWGQSGVDIFFAISGFIMVATTRSHWGDWRQAGIFLRRRLVRVVPMYWLATFVKIAMLALAGPMAVHGGVTVSRTVAALLFIPSRGVGEREVAPILSVGWTLSFEMLFYLLFAAALFASARPVRLVASALLMLALVGLSVNGRLPDWLSLVNPILIEFLFGVLVAHLALAHRLPSPTLAAVLFITATLALVATRWLPVNFMGPQMLWNGRAVIFGFPGAALLLAAVALEEKVDGAGLIARIGARLGDASYSIYLTHGLYLPVLGLFATRLHLHDAAAVLALMIAGLAGAAVLGMLVHIYVERPLLVLLGSREKLSRKPSMVETRGAFAPAASGALSDGRRS